MILSKVKTYFLLQAFCAVCLLFCQSIWISSQPVNASATGFYIDYLMGDNKDFVTVTYPADGTIYTSRFSGDAFDHRIKSLRIRYLTFDPTIARVDDFVGNWLLYLIVYLVWFLFTSMMFFVSNDVVPRGTMFYVGGFFPWLRKYKG